MCVCGWGEIIGDMQSTYTSVRLAHEFLAGGATEITNVITTMASAMTIPTDIRILLGACTYCAVV